MSKYVALVEEVRKAYESIGNERNNKQVQMGWCEHCKEINLWTYWQGLDFQEDKKWGLTSNNEENSIFDLAVK